MEEYKLFQGDNNEVVSQSNNSMLAASQDSFSGSTNEPRIQVPRESISRQGSQSSLTENQSCSSEDKNSSKSNLILPIVQAPDDTNKDQQPLQDDMVSIIDHDALHLNDLSPPGSVLEAEVSKTYEKRI